MKGQEFDVFRLLISAGIAIAIFLILMNLLGGLTIFGNQLDDAIKNAINQCGFNCACYTSRAVVSGTQGTEIDVQSIAEEAGVVGINSIHIGNSIEGKYLSENGDSISIEKTMTNLPLYIAVRCEDGNCDIGIGTNPDDAKSGVC